MKVLEKLKSVRAVSFTKLRGKLPLSVIEYQKHYEEQQIKYIKKRAANLGYQLLLVPA